MKILFLGESQVYYNRSNDNYNSLFYHGGYLDDDYLCLYILLLLYRRYTRFQRSNNFGDLAVSETELHFAFTESICNTGEKTDEIHKSAMLSRISRIISYFLESGFLKIADLPSNKTERPFDEVRYYLTPRGAVLFEEFTSSSILFEIFRDDFSLDPSRYKKQCSSRLQQSELFEEYLKYIQDFWAYECPIIESIFFSSFESPKDSYNAWFGPIPMSKFMVDSLLESYHIYYSEGRKTVQEKELLDKIYKLNRSIISKIEIINE